MMRSTSSYRLRTPGYHLHGRRQQNRSSSFRRATFTLRNPVPTGVVMGPLMATPFSRIELRTWSGRGVPYSSMTSAPACWTSQSKATPVPSRTRRVASDSSGPTPSPGMNVTRCPIAVAPSAVEPASYRPARGRPRSGGGSLGGSAPAGGDRVEVTVSEKGLADVVAAETALSDIDGKLGKLFYVGFDIHELARYSTFEETCFLLHNQLLPD